MTTFLAKADSFKSLTNKEMEEVLNNSFIGVFFAIDDVLDPEEGWDICCVNIVASSSASYEMKVAAEVWQQANPSRLFATPADAICTFLDCVNEQKEKTQ